MSLNAGSPARVVSRAGTTVTVAVSGEVDIANVAQLRSCLTACLARGCADIILDVEDLSFIDVTGLSVLAEIARLAGSRCGRLTLWKPSPMVQKLLDITWLTDLIDVADPDLRYEHP